MTRYASMFERCAAQERGAIVPFVMLGDPTPASCEAIIEALIADGADALELGIPFSDPVADGVVIQEAHLRALQAGTAIDECFRILSRIRNSHPDLPIGLLVYANVPFSIGVDRFYEFCAQAGVDSVLIPDLPIREGHPFGEAALKSGIDSVYIAPPSASPRTLSDVAHSARGYVYAVSRVGVTRPSTPSSNSLVMRALFRQWSLLTPWLTPSRWRVSSRIRVIPKALIHAKGTSPHCSCVYPAEATRISTKYASAWEAPSPGMGRLPAPLNWLHKNVPALEPIGPIPMIWVHLRRNDDSLRINV